MVPRRQFGTTLVSLSTICYGTMRLVPSRFSADALLTLLLQALDAGITSFHVSREYESYDAVCDALKRARAERPGQSIEIVAKLAVPHFDEPELDPQRLRLLVETTLLDLDIERVDVVQWLVRQAPNDDATRLAVFERGAAAFFHAWGELQVQGKAVALGVFPYSDAFLQRVLACPQVDGVVSYYNANESELSPYLGAFSSSGRGLIGIRPLAGGTIRDPAGVSKALAFALNHPAIASTIVGLSSSEQIQLAAQAGRDSQ